MSETAPKQLHYSSASPRQDMAAGATKAGGEEGGTERKVADK